MEEIKKITQHTAVSLSLIISVIGGIISGTWCLSKLATQVEQNTEAINIVGSKVETVPTRIEFDQLKLDIIEIKKDIKTLLQSR